jgi:hypothetical protein
MKVFHRKGFNPFKKFYAMSNRSISKNIIDGFWLIVAVVTLLLVLNVFFALI